MLTGLIIRAFYVYVCCLNLRLLRYVWWFLWELGCIFSGVGIDEKKEPKGELDYSSIRNADIVKFELGYDGQAWRYWNARMQSWLHGHVYTRLGLKGKTAKPFKVLATFFLCGVWVSINKPL